MREAHHTALGLLRIVLACLLALGTALPAFAQLAAGPEAHLCHCDAGGDDHASCACPRCFPDRFEEDGLSGPSVTGRCGDDLATAQFTFGVFLLAPSMRMAAPDVGAPASSPPPSMGLGRSRAPPMGRPPKTA